ncbi:TPA: hypothetical protein ACPE7F_002351 [Staphylococcus aureus]|nr:hypothetical protein [Staphylococcus aureus]MBV2631000.1 hypothetical protein [Staphylococcus aureus]MBV2633593.1 hypothetical protein [Staphylococcus aureus]HEK6687694.1 hypothetical protein [Staphylococcus aureus]
MKQISIGYEEIYGDRIFHGHFLKEQEVKNWKTVNQIIENEHLDKSEYEAEPPLFFFSGSLD